MKLQVVRGLAIACFAVLSASGARAQETINYASVSGRVVDPQGAVVPGAHGHGAADRDQRHGRGRRPTRTAASASRICRVGPYEVTVHLRRVRGRDAHADADASARRSTCRSRSRVAGVDTSVTVTGEAPVLETARSQIAGTVPQAEVQSLPMNGRNFLDLALLVPGVSPTNIGSTQLFAETSAVPGAGPLGRQPAQPLEQLHRRRPVGQRRRRGAERHPVRRGRGRAVPGRHVGRPGRARPRARRLRQRRHQERHQRAARRRSTATSATTRFNARERAVGHDAADEPAAVRRQPRRADRARTGRSTSPTSSSGGSTRPASSTITAANVAIDQRAAGGGRLSGRAGRRPASIRNPVDSTNVLGKVDHQFSGARSAQRALQPVRRRRRATRAAPAG